MSKRQVVVQASALRRTRERKGRSRPVSVDFRSYPSGQDEEEEEEEEGEKIREVRQCARGRSIDHGALKSQDPQHAVKTKTRTKNSTELETVFRGSAACKPQITDPTEFHRILLNRH